MVEQGVLPSRTCALTVTAFRLRTTFGGSWLGMKKPCSWWCAACGGQYDWMAPNTMLVIQDSTDPPEATFFRAHAVSQGTCDQRAEAPNQLGEGWRQSSSNDCHRFVGENRIMDGARKFILEDNHKAVKVEDLHRDTISKKAVKPDFMFPGAVIKEGAYELTLRAHQKGIAQNNERAQVVFCSRQLCGSKDRGLAERNEVQENGKAKARDRFPGRPPMRAREEGVLRTSIDVTNVGSNIMGVSVS